MRGLWSLGNVGRGAVALEIRVRIVLLETGRRGIPPEFLQVGMRIIAVRPRKLNQASIRRYPGVRSCCADYVLLMLRFMLRGGGSRRVCLAVDRAGRPLCYMPGPALRLRRQMLRWHICACFSCERMARRQDWNCLFRGRRAAV